MAIIKCKMCGGELKILPNSTICECEYCGSKQTIPNTDDEKRLKLYERANKLRFENEFDKAAGVYESIVAEYQNEAEAYWGLVLCKYGIEYVDDPKTGKKIPTCHRSSFDSVMDDSNLDLVMENSDTVARGIYREEAKQIEELRKGIVEVSSKEEPYDIFICYKETADDGQRTIDSVIAQDVYQELTDKGYRVFFSRITLEDKLGQEYEPYIFAALNSAKVMLAFGTCYDYYNAVWVKNEWRRFLQLMEAGQKKTLIPCFKDIDAYDMPKEFARLQAQDMGKVGAIQDLLRGIDKILGKTRNLSSDSVTEKGAEPVEKTIKEFLMDNLNSNLDKAEKSLQEGLWNDAKKYAKYVVMTDKDNLRAYLIVLMAEGKVKEVSKLRNIDNLPYYRRAYELADENLKKILEERKYDYHKDVIYRRAVKVIKNSKDINNYKKSLDELKTINGYHDSNELIKQCEAFIEKYEQERYEEKKKQYDEAVELMNKSSTDDKYVQKALAFFQNNIDFLDSSQLEKKCKNKIRQEELKKERTKLERSNDELRWNGVSAGLCFAVSIMLLICGIVISTPMLGLMGGVFLISGFCFIICGNNTVKKNNAKIDEINKMIDSL